MENLKYGAIPEDFGIESSDVIAFLDDLDFRGLNMHSIMIIADGNVVTEGYWAPFDSSRLQRMYSTSKSFVSMAIGSLVTEGKVALDDKVPKFFPEYEEADPLLAETTVYDLLTMSSPFAGTTYVDYSNGGIVNDENWAKTYFDAKPLRPAGTAFDYDTSATYILGVIVERVSGKSFVEYLKDRFLRDIGFSENASCVKAPEGYAWGGSGVLCTTRDLARFAKVVADGGKVGETQVISEQYVKEATSKRVSNYESGFTDFFHGNGYGYQIWMTKHGYAFLGMGGQCALFFPQKKLICIFTGDNQGHQVGYISAAYSFINKIYDKMSDKAIARNDRAFAELGERLANLKQPLPVGVDHTPAESEYFDRKFVLEPNRMGIEWFILTSDGKFRYKNQRGEMEYEFGFGEYKATKFPETHYCDEVISVPGGRKFDAMAAGRWSEEKKFTLRTFITDTYLGNLTATFGFKDNRVGIKMTKTAEWFLNEYVGFAWGKMDE